LDLLYLTDAIEDDRMSKAELCNIFRNNVVAFRLKTRRLEVQPHTHSVAFSVKTVFDGLERYQFEEREVGVAAGEVLLVSPGRTYGSSIRTSEPTDSFSVFFPHWWIEETIKLPQVDHVRRLLDSGASSVSLPVAPELNAAIRELACTLSQREGDALAGEEALTGVVHRVFSFVENAGELASRIDAAHPSTRLELLRRVSRVRDLLESRVQAGTSLAELAREACLSEFHLLRVFKQAFGTTPARYLERRRMDKARTLLLGTELPIADVAASCGYSNLSAFGRAFRRAWGNSATIVREEQSSAPARRTAE
jgi:AraC-like DNA-binding protein